MDNQAKITLTSLNGGVGPVQRTFVLSADRLSISVGRASKSASKGLLGAADNAWFDSPVMSRNHAVVSFDPDEKAVMIEDIGSMHGTFLNDAQLPLKTVTIVRNEDEVKFGAEVRRGPETFPACRFRVSYDVAPRKSTSSYKFPDYSDIEDEEEEDEGLSFSDEVGRASSDDDHSIESPVSKPTSSNNPIDLTRDDSPIRSNHVDLTDDTPVDTPAETPAEMSLMRVLTGRPSDISETASYSNIAVYAGNPITVCEPSDDEDAHFSTDSEDQVDDDDSSDSESSSDEKEYGLDEVLDDILDGDDIVDEAGESEDEYPEDYLMDEDDEDDDNQTSTSVMRSMHRFAHATNDYTVVRLSEPLPADESSADEEDDESDFGLSEAGEEGLKALRDGGLLQSLPEDVFTQAPGAYQATQTSTGSTAGPYVSFRQPSPSDAAMVKSQVTPAVPVSASTQSLGISSGKSEFFAAREVNKNKFISQEIEKSKFQPEIETAAHSRISNGLNVFGSPETTAVAHSKIASNIHLFGSPDFTCAPNQSQAPMPQAHSQQLFDGKTAYSIFNNPGASMASFPATQPTSFTFANAGAYTTRKSAEAMFTDVAMPRRDECAFLDTPTTVPMPYREVGPSVDMTSAATFSAAKNSATTLLKATSVLKIQDLCGNPVPPKTNLKRKAQDISEDANEELRTWGNGTALCLQSPSATTVIPNPESIVQPNLDGPRPTKRFRKFLERAGYVAIGGVAVGSALFTALIATAPEFV